MGGDEYRRILSDDEVWATAELEFQRLATEWGLTNWQLIRNRRLTASLGRCCHYIRVIELGACYGRQAALGAVLDTVRHEIAHAIDWEVNRRSDHSPRWREIARLVGCHPRAAVSPSEGIAAVAKTTGR